MALLGEIPAKFCVKYAQGPKKLYCFPQKVKKLRNEPPFRVEKHLEASRLRLPPPGGRVRGSSALSDCGAWL